MQRRSTHRDTTVSGSGDTTIIQPRKDSQGMSCAYLSEAILDVQNHGKSPFPLACSYVVDEMERKLLPFSCCTTYSCRHVLQEPQSHVRTKEVWGTFVNLTVRMYDAGCQNRLHGVLPMTLLQIMILSLISRSSMSFAEKFFFDRYGQHLFVGLMLRSSMYTADHDIPGADQFANE